MRIADWHIVEWDNHTTITLFIGYVVAFTLAGGLALVGPIPLAWIAVTSWLVLACLLSFPSEWSKVSSSERMKYFVGRTIVLLALPLAFATSFAFLVRQFVTADALRAAERANLHPALAIGFGFVAVTLGGFFLYRQLSGRTYALEEERRHQAKTSTFEKNHGSCQHDWNRGLEGYSHHTGEEFNIPPSCTRCKISKPVWEDFLLQKERSKADSRARSSGRRASAIHWRSLRYIALAAIGVVIAVIVFQAAVGIIAATADAPLRSSHQDRASTPII